MALANWFPEPVMPCQVVNLGGLLVELQHHGASVFVFGCTALSGSSRLRKKYGHA